MRVEPAERDRLAKADRDSYDAVIEILDQPFFSAEEKKYDAREIFDGLLHSPRFTLKLLELGGSLRNLGAIGDDSGAPLPDDFVEFIAFTVFAELHHQAASRGSHYDYTRNMHNHMRRAIESGLRPESIRALREADDEALTQSELEVAMFVRAVLHGDVSDELWSRIEKRLGVRRAIESAAFAVLDFFVCRLQSALALSNAAHEEVDQLLEGYLSAEGRQSVGLSL